MSTPSPQESAFLMQTDVNRYVCHGNWTTYTTQELKKHIDKLSLPIEAKVTLEGQNLDKLDTAGAWLIKYLINKLQTKRSAVTLVNFDAHHSTMLNLVDEESKKIKPALTHPKALDWVSKLGMITIEKLSQIFLFLSFLGELANDILQVLLSPRKLQWRSILYNIQVTGYRALPIIGLLSFLIGVVLAYQMGLQLETYGANIYVVNFSSIAVLREFGPLIAAIIVIGRTGSAFTAELGTMKVTAEIDAIQTMGLSPINRLVTPKLIGLLIALPLLTLWSDIFGMLGSMMMSHIMLDVDARAYISRFIEVTDLSTYLLGLCKAPVFAIIIAAVGCFQGLQVESNAESIGKQTTKSVVQAIFLIIVADAGFSVVFSWLGL